MAFKIVTVLGLLVAAASAQTLGLSYEQAKYGNTVDPYHNVSLNHFFANLLQSLIGLIGWMTSETEQQAI